MGVDRVYKVNIFNNLGTIFFFFKFLRISFKFRDENIFNHAFFTLFFVFLNFHKLKFSFPNFKRFVFRP